MGKIIVEDGLLRRGFIQVPVLIWFDEDLSAGAKLFYGQLLWYNWRGQEYPGHEQAALDAGTSRSSILRHVSELEKHGFVVSERPGLGETNSYRLPKLTDPIDRK